MESISFSCFILCINCLRMYIVAEKGHTKKNDNNVTHFGTHISTKLLHKMNVDTASPFVFGS